MAIVGIDLGTTNTCAAVWRDGEPQIIPNSEGSPLTPSVVAFDAEQQEWVVGQAARQLAKCHPVMSVYSIKRFVGRSFGDAMVQEAIHKLRILYEIEESVKKKSGINVVLGEFHLTPPEVSAKILQKIKVDAEQFLGCPVNEAVVTVPAYFHDSQRQATRDAGKIAGLEVRRVFNEPTAACLAFGYKKLAEERKTVAVYDLGGGTFDISILDVGRGPFRVRSTNGRTDLGGDDLDWMIVDWFLDQLDKTDKKRLHDDLVVLAHLRSIAEEAKIILSTTKEFHLILSEPVIPAPELNNQEFHLTRTRLESLAANWIEQTFDPCKQALIDARLTVGDLREVLLVGGQTKMPAVRKAVREFFGQEPNTNLNPDEVVGLGAAVQAAILAGQATGLRLADVIPLTLGVNTKGRMDAILKRNTPIPIKQSKIYSTASDNQESVEVQVYQGEHPMSDHNVKLASFMLRGIEPSPAGDPEIEVTFDVDEDGILHVAGKDIQTGNYQEVTITDSIKLTEDEIQAIVRDAEEHAVEYAEQRRQAELMEQAENLRRHLSAEIERNKDGLPEQIILSASQLLEVVSPSQWDDYVTKLQGLLKEISETLSKA